MTSTSAREAPTATPRPEAPVRRRERVDWVLVAGLAACGVLAVVLRGWGALDLPITTDEPTIVDRAIAAARGDVVPSGFDYPPLSAYVLAPFLAAAEALRPGFLDSPTGPYLAGRVVYTLLAGIGVVLTGLLGAAVAGPLAGRADEPRAAAVRRQRLVGVGAAAALAVSYLSVRLGNHARPDHLQLLFIVAALLATARWLRSRSTGWLLGAGLMAGLAAASKYAGGVVVLISLAAVVGTRPRPLALLRDVALLGAAALAGFLGGTLGTVLTQWDQFVAGFLTEFRHQTGVHLGYEAEGSGWWFHLTESLPGNWGWVVTALAVGGVVLALARGTAGQRAVAGFGVLALLLAGLSAVRFPHYALVPLPALAVTAGLALAWLADRLPRAAALALVGVVGGTLLVTLADDYRLIRARQAPDTRALAVPLQEPYGDDLIAEAYTATRSGGTAMFALGADPAVPDCDCVVAVSSYQEERFRRRPDLYPAEIAVYDAIRARGRSLGEVGPNVHLPYNWDLLPQWGLRRLPLTGELGPVGPRIEVLDLRR